MAVKTRLIKLNGEITFDLNAQTYASEFALRTFAVLQKDGTTGDSAEYVCVYGGQYGYGLEAYINTMYGSEDENGKMYPSFDNLLYWTWNLAQVAIGNSPLGTEVVA